MAAIRGHDLQLQSIQKVMTKAMLPLVRLADSFLLAESDSAEMPAPTDALHACLSSFRLLATANLQMDQLHRDGFKDALPPQYKGLTTIPDPPTELLFGDHDNRMKDLDEKAKLETNLRPGPSKSSSPPPPAVTRHIHLGMQPSVPIIVFLPPPWLQKTCVVSPQWKIYHRLRGNKAEEGSHTPKGKPYSLSY